MKREDLKKLGLADDVVDKVMLMHGSTSEELKSTKAQLETVNAQLTQANTTINELNEKVNKAPNVDELKAQIQTQKEAYEKQIEDIKYDHALANYLSSITFSSDLVKEAVTNKFKEKSFKLENGKLLGADDYIEELKKSQPSAFVVETKPEDNNSGQGGIRTNGIGGENGGTPQSTFKSMF